MIEKFVQQQLPSFLIAERRRKGGLRSSQVLRHPQEVLYKTQTICAPASNKDKTNNNERNTQTARLKSGIMLLSPSVPARMHFTTFCSSSTTKRYEGIY